MNNQGTKIHNDNNSSIKKVWLLIKKKAQSKLKKDGIITEEPKESHAEHSKICPICWNTNISMYITKM